MTDALFGTHIREAVALLRGGTNAGQSVTNSGQPECQHCDHDTGNGSGSAASDGSGHSSGTLVCCHCGRRVHYDYRYGPREVRTHGRYLP